MFGLPIPKFICTHKIKEYIIYEITDLLIDEKIFEQKGPGFCSNILRAKERSADLHLQSFSDSSVEARSNNIFVQCVPTSHKSQTIQRNKKGA